MREYFGETVMGAAYGGVFLVSTLGMGLGSFAGGWIFDPAGQLRLALHRLRRHRRGVVAYALRAPRLAPAAMAP